MLVLACHNVASPTAKVPFSMILLLDFAKRKATPLGSKCRMVIPSDGVSSISLWDTEDPSGLLEWLTENLGQDCTTELQEVQEDFTWGLSLELARMRAAEKVTDGSMKTIGALAAGVTTAVGSTQQKLEAWDERTGVITGAKERTVALQQKVVTAMSKAAENEKVQTVVANVSTGVSSGWAKVSSWVGARLGEVQGHDGSEYDYQPGSGAAAAAAGGGYGAAPAAAAPPSYDYQPTGQPGGRDASQRESMDRPLTFSDSMLEDPTLGSPPHSSSAATAAGAGGQTAGGPAGGSAGLQ